MIHKDHERIVICLPKLRNICLVHKSGQHMIFYLIKGILYVQDQF